MMNGKRKREPDTDAGENERRDSDNDALDEQLDEELEKSFPASDPPSVTQEPRNRR